MGNPSLEGGPKSSSTGGPPSDARHPFAAALEARDHPALVDILAPDVVLHQPVTLTFSPLRHDHINLHGRYYFTPCEAVTKGELRSLRSSAP